MVCSIFARKRCGLDSLESVGFEVVGRAASSRKGSFSLRSVVGCGEPYRDQESSCGERARRAIVWVKIALTGAQSPKYE